MRNLIFDAIIVGVTDAIAAGMLELPFGGLTGVFRSLSVLR